MVKVIYKTSVGYMQYINGEKYEGSWKNGHKNGHGKWYYLNGSYFDGDWVENVICGKGNCLSDWLGVYYYINGNRYDGEWTDNKRNGYGNPFKLIIRNPLLWQWR